MLCVSTDPATVAAMEGLVTGTTLSQVAIGRELGVSRSTVARYIGLHRWTRPPGAPVCTGAFQAITPDGEAAADDVPALIAHCLRLLKHQVAAIGRGRGASRTKALRAVAETGRTLKELSRIAASLGAPDRPAPDRPAAPEIPDDFDEARFLALCDDIAVRFALWEERQAAPLLPRDADAAGGA